MLLNVGPGSDGIKLIIMNFYTRIYTLFCTFFVENMAFIIELDFCLYLSITNLYGLGKLVSTSGTLFYTTECLL